MCSLLFGKVSMPKARNVMQLFRIHAYRLLASSTSLYKELPEKPLKNLPRNTGSSELIRVWETVDKFIFEKMGQRWICTIALLSLIPRKKWSTGKIDIRMNVIVILEDTNMIRENAICKGCQRVYTKKKMERLEMWW